MFSAGSATSGVTTEGSGDAVTSGTRPGSGAAVDSLPRERNAIPAADTVAIATTAAIAHDAGRGREPVTGRGASRMGLSVVGASPLTAGSSSAETTLAGSSAAAARIATRYSPASAKRAAGSRASERMMAAATAAEIGIREAPRMSAIESVRIEEITAIGLSLFAHGNRPASIS